MKNWMRTPQVFNYLDYREFLQALISNRARTEKRNPAHRLARLAEIDGHHLDDVLHYMKNLDVSKAFALAAACSLGGQETDYFVTLVLWNQAEEDRIKEILWQRLVLLSPKDVCAPFIIAEKKLTSKWYFQNLVELSKSEDFKDDPDWLYEYFDKKVSAEELEESLDMLCALGHLRLNTVEREQAVKI